MALPVPHRLVLMYRYRVVQGVIGRELEICSHVSPEQHSSESAELNMLADLIRLLAMMPPKAPFQARQARLGRTMIGVFKQASQAQI